VVNVVLGGAVEPDGMQAAHRGMIRFFTGCRVRMPTYEKGKEFARHGPIYEILGSVGYFVNPYRSWKTGSN